MNQDKQEGMIESLDRVMRLLRRRAHNRLHTGRGVYRLLRIVQNHPAISTRELAEMLDVRPSSLNERLVALESEEMIIRNRDADDQRVFTVSILPKGIEHLEEVASARSEFHEVLKSILSEEETEQFQYLAAKFADGLETVLPPDEPSGENGYRRGSRRRHHR